MGAADIEEQLHLGGTSDEGAEIQNPDELHAELERMLQAQWERLENPRVGESIMIYDVDGIWFIHGTQNGPCRQRYASIVQHDDSEYDMFFN